MVQLHLQSMCDGPACLSTMNRLAILCLVLASVLGAAATSMKDPLCSLVAATSIGSVSPDWQCSSEGQPATDPCGWPGVSCPSNSTNVTSISLNEYYISGTIPSQLGSLSTLSALDLSYNSLSSSVPASLGSLTALTSLSVHSNCLTGTLPTELGTLSRLSSLAVQYNALTGSLDAVYTLTALTRLDAYELQLDGALAAGIGNLTALQELNLASSNLHGPLPSALGLLTSLRTAFLETNSFSGTIPSSLGEWDLLVEFVISETFLSGPLPTSLARLTSLTFLNIGHNSLSGSLPVVVFSGMTKLFSLTISGNRFTGSIAALCTLGSTISYIQGASNRFNGTIPPAISSLTHIREIFLYDNALSGPIPSTIGTMEVLYTLQLSVNCLTGSLPIELGNATALQTLNVSFNFITGSIPSSYQKLTNLASLMLSTNSLSGTIPDSIYTHSLQMKDLSLSDNHFHGTVSEAIGDLKVLKYYYASYNDLTSSIPSSIGQISALNYFDIQSTSMSGTIPSTLCDSAVTGLRLTVSDTSIHCYEGCLTSAPVEVVGASSMCPDGSIIKRFLIICGIVVGGIAMFQLSRLFIPIRPRNRIVQPSPDVASGGIFSRTSGRLRDLGVRYPSLGRVFHGLAGLFSRRIVVISAVKALLVVVVVLVIERDWQFCGSSDPTEAVAGYSCTSNNIDFCSSFCGDVELTLFKVDDPVTLNSVSFGYCTAIFTESCACRYWQIFSLIPLMLHLLQFLLQGGCFFLLNDFNPQQVLYELILQHIRGDVALRDMVMPFSNPWYGLLPFIEVATVVLVWLALPFSPTHCGSSVPSLSQYYYPMVMTVLDTWKLNVFFAAREYEQHGLYAALLALFDVRVAVVHFGFCVCQSVVYVFSILLLGAPFLRFHHHTVYSNNKLNAQLHNETAAADFRSGSEDSSAGGGGAVVISMERRTLSHLPTSASSPAEEKMRPEEVVVENPMMAAGKVDVP